MQLNSKRKLALVFLVVLISTNCQRAPVLPEAETAKQVETRLWRAGASIFAPEEYNSFRERLKAARIHELREGRRLPLMRRMKKVREEYQSVIAEGEKIFLLVEEKKGKEKNRLLTRLSDLESWVQSLREIGSAINESHGLRQRVTRAEVLIAEARQQLKEEKFDKAEKSMAEAAAQARSARYLVLSLFERYLNENYLQRWEKWTEETIAESREKGKIAIIVDKLEKKLWVYHKGEKKAVYDVGLGRFALADKLHAGDEATPEGKYKVTKKIPQSRYYKALLLDYPNQDDLRQFQEMKKKGLIPPKVGIGGLIEIHGGGQDGLTYGCVAMEDKVMDEIFSLAEVGTPVTIVGTFNRDSAILKLVKELLSKE